MLSSDGPFCGKACRRRAKEHERKMDALRGSITGTCPWYQGLIEGTARRADPMWGF